MKVSLTHDYLGHTFTLTLDSDVTDDLQRYDVDSRITSVMRREVGRFAEIVAVALGDRTHDLAVDAERRRRRAAGEPEPVKGPAMILAAGTKKAEGRVVMETEQ